MGIKFRMVQAETRHQQRPHEGFPARSKWHSAAGSSTPQDTAAFRGPGEAAIRNVDGAAGPEDSQPPPDDQSSPLLSGQTRGSAQALADLHVLPFNPENAAVVRVRPQGWSLTWPTTAAWAGVSPPHQRLP
jgi:hypothetical protein